MRFDLFYELSLPPFLPRGEAQLYIDTLAELELADRLGFGCAWLVEHHFLPGYSHSSKPELFLAAASQRTRKLRLGLGVIPLPYHHPIHVAERVATLDLLSGGRLEVGIGRGFSPREYAAFGADMGQSRRLTEQGLDVLRAAFSGRPLPDPYAGLTILPAPLQTPPPLWSAAVSPDSFRWAATQGLGVLAGPFKPWFMVRRDIAAYRAAWAGTQAPRIGMTVGVLCLADGRRARRLAQPAFEWFYGELFKTTLPVLERLYPSYEHFHDLGRLRRLIGLGARLRVLEALGMAVVGDPAHCRERLARYGRAGVTHLLLAVGAGAVDSEVARESLVCLAEQVLPHLA